MSEIQEKSYVTYRISGITGIQIMDGTLVNLVDDNFDSVFVNDSLSEVTIYIRDEADFQQALQECERFIYKFVLSLIIHEEAVVGVPEYKKEKTFLKSENEDVVTFSTDISIESSISYTSIYPGEEFLGNILKDQDMITSNNELMYKRLYSIMRNRDRVTKYLALYEFLLDLVSIGKPKKEQKNVSDFIKQKGFDRGSNSISFHPTRRRNANFLEDLLTYYRNEIAHAEFENDFSKYEDLASNINSKLINKVIEVINCAISDC